MRIRVRGKSFLAFVLAPEPPLSAWLAELDAQSARSPGFFESRPVVIDFAAIESEETPGLETLIADLEARGVTVIDVENAGSLKQADPWRRPLVGGRSTGEIVLPEVGVAPEIPAPPPVTEPAPPAETSLMVPEAVRSGQSVLFLGGDVTVLGAVGSGAEVLAGGSIHVYGALRGRAIAGALGNAKARIFCQKFEAELVSIDGFYRTADSIDPALRGRAVSVALEGEAIIVVPLG